MSRRKKEKTLQMKEKHEVVMSESVVLEGLEALEKEMDEKRLELEQVKRELEEKRAELEKIPARVIENDEKEVMQKHEVLSKEKLKGREIIERQKARDNVMVTGKFMNRRAPGQSVKLPYLKYADDPVKWHPFNDGQVYTIPRGFADQINGGTDEDPCYYTPTFKQKQGELLPSNTVGENSQIAEVDTSNKRYSFVPINF